MERRVLGRGLDALISPTAIDTAPKEKVQMLKLEQIYASKYQPRLQFSDHKIEELAQSIKEKGVIQPILVRSTALDRYELIAGERRFRAAKLAGLKTGEKVSIIVYNNKVEIVPFKKMSNAMMAMLASEEVLSKNWLSKEDEKAWKDL